MNKSKASSTLSIIINNYNYGCFLSECIESALNQIVQADEIIVVDDGSSDNSRQVLEKYDQQVKVIYQENAGQASAMNTGFAASSGKWIWFLDADDWLQSNAIETVVSHLSNRYTRIQGRLIVMDKNNVMLGLVPKNGDTSFVFAPAARLLSDTPLPNLAPTSGNIFSRQFLEEIMPIPEQTYRICSDEYLFYAGLNSQLIFHTPEVIGYYRSHGKNAYLTTTFFYTDKTKILSRIGSTIRPRKLFLSQFPEVKERGGDYTFSFNHLKTMIIADRVLTDTSSLPLSRGEMRSLYRQKLKKAKRDIGWAKESFSFLILCHAPFFLINLIGKLETKIRCLTCKRLKINCR
jgi:glycosyltransferase involved in cell wall biosynthesis